jgi:hypothetical protein
MKAFIAFLPALFLSQAFAGDVPAQSSSASQASTAATHRYLISGRCARRAERGGQGQDQLDQCKIWRPVGDLLRERQEDQDLLHLRSAQ